MLLPTGHVSILHMGHENPSSGVDTVATWPDILQTLQEMPHGQWQAFVPSYASPLANANTMPRHDLLLRWKAF